MNVDLLVHIIEIVVLIGLYVGLVRAIGIVVHEAGERYADPQAEPPRHVRILRGDES